MPKGEMPRHMQLFCDQYLTDRVVPGNRVTVIGIYSIRKSGMKPAKVHGRTMFGLLPGSTTSVPPSSLAVRRQAVLVCGGHTCVWLGLRLTPRVLGGPVAFL